MDYETASAAFDYGQGNDYVILIHGFPSIPYDLMPLGRYLAEHGFHAIGVKMPGFGGSKENLRKHADWRLWYGEIDRVIKEVKAKGAKNIFVTGISMGGTATLYTAIQHPEITALAPINGPVLIKQKSAQLVGFFALFVKYFNFDSSDAVLKPESKNDPILLEMSRRYDHKGVLPAVATEVHWFNKTKRNLHKITQPILICQSEKDQTIWLKNPDYILSKVSSQDKKINWYPNSDHNITYDYDAPVLCKDIMLFFKKYCT